MKNPYWIEDSDTGEGEVEFLSEKEIDFWHGFIHKYLLPLDDDKNEREKVRKSDYWNTYSMKTFGERQDHYN